MSENGRMPVVVERGNDKPLCGFKEVFWHISKLNHQVPSLLELAYMDWIETKFLEAEMYVCWCYEPVLNDYTRNRYMYDIPWPVSKILFDRKRNQVQASIGSRFTDFTDFISKFSKFLTQLSKVIGNRPFCLQEPGTSSINALIYGHANAIMDISLHPKFVEAITWQKRIGNLVKFIEEHYPS